MRTLPLFVVLVLLAGCTTEPRKEPPPPAPREPVKAVWDVDRAVTAIDEAQSRFEQDWQEAIATEGGGQRLALRNSVRAEVGGGPGTPDDGAMDVAGWIAFRPPEPGARPEREFVEWFVVRDPAAEKSVEATPALAAQRGGRPLFALHRRVWRLGEVDAGMGVLDQRLKAGLPIALEPADSVAVEPGKPRPALALLSDKVVATGLLTWNIEVYDPDEKDPYLGLFVELEQSKVYLVAAMPIGAAAKSPTLPRKLRVTARVPDPEAKGCGRPMPREVVRPQK